MPPSPRPRSQSALPLRGRGRLLVYFAGGWRPRHPCAEPLAALTSHTIQGSPRGLNPGGAGEGRRLTRRRGAGGFGCRIAPAAMVPKGGLPPRSPACPAFIVLSAPIPLPPFPAGRGRPRLFLCKGLRPLHPRHLTAYGTEQSCHTGNPRGAEPGRHWGGVAAHAPGGG